MATANAKVLSAATSKDEALSWLMAGEITVEDYKRWDASKAPPQSFSMKVSEKGAISIRGIKGISVKFGLTMYAVVYEELFARQAEIKAFIAANSAKLSRK